MQILSRVARGTVADLKESRQVNFLVPMAMDRREGVSSAVEAPNCFTEEQIYSFRDAFLGYDRFGDGRVRVKELGKILKACGENPSMEELHQLWNEASVDGKKTIDFADFLNIMAKRLVFDPEGDIKAAFRTFDVKATGFIDGLELRHVLENLHEVDISSQEIGELIEDIDLNKDGRINYGEFLNVMKTAEDFETVGRLKRRSEGSRHNDAIKMDA